MNVFLDCLSGRKNDEYYTPRYAVLPILRYLPKDAVVWCPFDTANSEFVLALKEQGFKVVHSHLVTGQDFYKYEPEYWDMIVSNPPFYGKAQIFERCLSFGKPFALLMSCLWLNESAPCRLFMEKDMQLLMFDKRVQYNDQRRAPFSSCYVCHEVLPKQVMFHNLQTERGISRMYGEMQEKRKTLANNRKVGADE